MTNERNLRPGEDSAGRGLPDDVRGETTWRQTTMYPPESVTVRLDLGWYRPENVGMFAAEAWVSNTHELLALEVHPLRRYGSLLEFLTLAQTWQGALVNDLLDPEPFRDGPEPRRD